MNQVQLSILVIVLAFPFAVVPSDLITNVTDGTLDRAYPVAVNKNLQQIIDYSKLSTEFPIRVSVESASSDRDLPTIIVVKQKKAVLSWQLPLIVDAGSSNLEYRDSGRTLCYESAKLRGSRESLNEELSVTISTSSLSNATATVIVTEETDFFLRLSVNYSVAVSPSTPRFYHFGFAANDSKWKDYETVTLEVFSEDSVCMTVSVQNSSCPVRDLNDDITFQGHYETISRKGGVTISKSDFPEGFFLVFVTKGTDLDCSGNPDVSNSTARAKSITFTIKPSITYDDYFNAVIVTLVTIAAFYITFGVGLCICNSRCYTPRTMDYVPTTSRSEENSSVAEDGVSTNDSEYDTLEDMTRHREVMLAKPRIFVSDLARKKQHVLIRRSYSYLWHVLTVGLFYLLPVVQLVIAYQKVLNDTGNRDLCYYNFFCAHPFGFFSDFNHLFSNIGYVLFGLLFLWITYRREQWHKDSIFEQNYGVPQHYGLFYAIGFALIMEGLLSGSYHICPSHANFQFDTSFMYVTAVLCMIKIYQTRHPDVNASAYSTFGILAVAILLGMVGILEAGLTVWIVFTIIHLLTCFYLTAHVYYMGCCSFDGGMFLRIFRSAVLEFRSSHFQALIPLHKSRMVLLIIGNLLNWTMAAFGIYSQADFAVYLLGLFMLNTVYYFVFYIVMKLLNYEKINPLPSMFLLISLTCAVVSMYCFLHKSISWSLTPAESRYYNQECVLMRFYDYHDLWHFLSAIGMFFMFMVLLTLDDDLSHTPRSQIPVF